MKKENRLQRKTAVKPEWITNEVWCDFQRLANRTFQKTLAIDDGDNGLFSHISVHGATMKVFVGWLRLNGYKTKRCIDPTSGSELAIDNLRRWLKHKGIPMKPTYLLEWLDFKVVKGHATRAVVKIGMPTSLLYIFNMYQSVMLSEHFIPDHRREFGFTVPKGVMKLFTAWAAGILATKARKHKTPAAHTQMSLRQLKKLHQLHKLSKLKQREHDVIVDEETMRKIRRGEPVDIPSQP